MSARSGLAAMLVPLFLLGCTSLPGAAGMTRTSVKPVSAPAAVEFPPATSAPARKAVAAADYSSEEIRHFIASAKRAQAIRHPLQRCLVYPDPPQAHWSRASVTAYCHFHWQPVMSAAEVRALIRHGHTARLDRRLNAAWHAQMARPQSRGLLDEIYQRDFADASHAERQLLDEWKRASPNSAFALAASGYAYVQMSIEARGEDYVWKTSPARLAAMDSDMALAETDLQHALTLNPRLTPAYIAWIHGANASRSDEFIDALAQRALATDPSDFLIYTVLMATQQPNWHGSIEKMQKLADQAQAHVADNPLLALLLPDVDYYAVENCRCDDGAQMAAYPKVFDRLASEKNMRDAGDTASDNSRSGMAVVFLSESLRFLPNPPRLAHALAGRSMRLSDLGEWQWARHDADTAIALNPHYAGGFKALAGVYEETHDYPRAIAALKSALAADDSDSWSMVELGNIYTFKTRDWNKAWKVSSDVIEKFPEQPYGWVQRGVIQMSQPRAGLKDTYDHFVARFGSDPNEQQWLRTFRHGLELQQGPGGLNSTQVKRVRG